MGEVSRILARRVVLAAAFRRGCASSSSETTVAAAARAAGMTGSRDFVGVAFVSAPPPATRAAPSSSAASASRRFFGSTSAVDSGGGGATTAATLDVNGGVGHVSNENETFNKIIVGHAESGRVADAEDLLEQMERLAESSGDARDLPDADAYAAVVDALLREQTSLLAAARDDAGDEEGSGRAAKAESDDRDGGARRRGAAMDLAGRAESLLIRMEDRSGVSVRHSPMGLGRGVPQTPPPGSASLRPAPRLYDGVVAAFANAAGEGGGAASPAARLADRWLCRAEALWAADPEFDVGPSAEAYRRVVECWSLITASTSPSSRGGRGGGGAERRSALSAVLAAQSAFDRMIEHGRDDQDGGSACAAAQRALMRAWCIAGGREGAYRATGLYMAMWGAFEDDRRGARDMEPTLEEGRAVLEAWAGAVNKFAARRAQSVLSHMERMHDTKVTDVTPDVECYQHVLVAMSRSKLPDVGQNLPDLFRTMEDRAITLNAACFDAAIETLRNGAVHPLSPDPDEYARSANDMLLQMEGMYDRTSVVVVRPSSRTYDNVIKALSATRKDRSAAAVRADALLRGMERATRGKKGSGGGGSGGNDGGASPARIAPTRDSYAWTIDAHANSDAVDRVSRAESVLRMMVRRHEEGADDAAQPPVPDAGSYHALIRACAGARSQRGGAGGGGNADGDALRVAISTVRAMKRSDHCDPDATSYLLLLECCENLLPPGEERAKALTSVFRNCRRDGLVDPSVLQRFRAAASFDAYHREVVMGASSYMGERALPEDWTRNLGYRVRVPAGEGGGRRSPAISVDGAIISSTEYNEHRMRRLQSRKNQQLLQGGRTK